MGASSSYEYLAKEASLVTARYDSVVVYEARELEWRLSKVCL